MEIIQVSFTLRISPFNSFNFFPTLRPLISYFVLYVVMSTKFPYKSQGTSSESLSAHKPNQTSGFWKTARLRRHHGFWALKLMNFSWISLNQVHLFNHRLKGASGCGDEETFWLDPNPPKLHSLSNNFTSKFIKSFCLSLFFLHPVSRTIL